MSRMKTFESAVAGEVDINLDCISAVKQSGLCLCKIYVNGVDKPFEVAGQRAAILALINGEEQCNSTDEVWILARDLAKECRSIYSVIAYNGGEVVANKMERLVTKLEESLVKNMPANTARAAVEGK